MPQEIEVINLDWSKNYRHTRSGNDYILLEEVWIQVNQDWVEAVVYTPVVKSDKKFVRSKKEFIEKFIVVLK